MLWDQALIPYLTLQSSFWPCPQLPRPHLPFQQSRAFMVDEAPGAWKDSAGREEEATSFIPSVPAGPQKTPPPLVFHHVCRASEGPPCLQGLRRLPQCSTMPVGPQKAHHAFRASESPPPVLHHVDRASEGPPAFAELKVQPLPAQKSMLWWLASVEESQTHSQAGCCLPAPHHRALQEGGGTWQGSSVWGALCGQHTCLPSLSLGHGLGNEFGLPGPEATILFY